MTWPPRRIVVGIDFSPLSEHALELAQGLASAVGASLTLVHVLDTAGYAMVGTPVLGDTPMTAVVPLDVAQLRGEAEASLRALAERHGARGELVVREGQPSAELCSASSNADLLVVGTHGRSGLRHLLLGSTAETIMRRCPTPVLTVRGAI